MPYRSIINDKSEEAEAKKSWKKVGSNTTTNSSTLSLHIIDYENSTASMCGKNNDEPKMERFESIIKGLRQFCTVSNLVIKNSFEFSRQQNDKISEPELSHFKASQRLIISNKVSNNSHQRHTDVVQQQPPRYSAAGMRQLQQPNRGVLVTL
uniref:Uncharacterized protein n=1 Tax=Panagrolaimus sp. PS1159 TaxID=55785 RepID=A0AC35EZ08_9BILA